MASGKDKHYWSQVLATLTAGSWDVSLPAKTPNGASLPWSELLRKFNKHCHGYSDVAELASQTQALSLLVEAGVSSQSTEGGDAGLVDSLSLGEECVLPHERRDEAAAGYAALKGLHTADKEVRWLCSLVNNRYSHCCVSADQTTSSLLRLRIGPSC